MEARRPGDAATPVAKNREGEEEEEAGSGADPSPTSEAELSKKMEMCRPESLSEGEGVKASNPKLPPPSSKKKAKKKKKKKKTPTAVHENVPEKSPGKARKQPIFGALPLKFLCYQNYPGTTPKELTNTKGIPGKTAGNPFLASASSALSLLAQEKVNPPNESLRWNGILEDPVAEEERLWNYRLNRRIRYGAYLQQNLPPEPDPAPAECLPEHSRVAPEENKPMLYKSKSSTILPGKLQSKPLSRIRSKIFKRQSTALWPSASQETV